MIAVVILSPIPALRAGLSALLAGDPELAVTATAARLDDLADLPGDTAVVVATPGAVDPADPALRPDLALLLVTDDARETAEWVRASGLVQAEPGPGPRAWGVLSPEASPEALQAAVRALAEGLMAASPEQLREALLSAGMMLPAGGAGRGGVGELAEEDGVTDHLTEREGEVLRLLAQGLTNKQIALALKISEHTVKFHVSSIYSKLGVSNRTEAVRKGARRGWVPL